MPVDNEYTISLLEQIGEQVDGAYDGLEIVRVISMSYPGGRGMQMLEVNKIQDPFTIAEFLADYMLSLEYIRQAKGSTMGYCYPLMCDFLNGMIPARSLMPSPLRGSGQH